MKIGVIYTTEVHNASYRALWPAEALRRRGGHQVELVAYDPRGRLNYERLLDCDVVHIYRRSDRGIVRAVDELLERGVAITYDNDDDVRLAPKGTDSYRKFGGASGERDFRTQVHMMKRAHVVTTTTEVLAGRWVDECAAPIEVVPNYLGDEQFKPGPRNADGVVIGWVAGGEHLADAKRLQISSALQRVLERRREVRVVSMGVKLELNADRYTHHPYIPLPELAAKVRGFDIGIAPLSDIPMSYARSDVKVKEYAAAGVPWVASNRGSYALLDAKKAGGLLVDDDAWEEALVDLATSKFKRRQMRRRAEKWGRSQHITKNVDRWEEVWARAIAVAAGQRSTPEVRVASVR